MDVLKRLQALRDRDIGILERDTAARFAETCYEPANSSRASAGFVDEMVSCCSPLCSLNSRSAFSILLRGPPTLTSRKNLAGSRRSGLGCGACAKGFCVQPTRYARVVALHILDANLLSKHLLLEQADLEEDGCDSLPIERCCGTRLIEPRDNGVQLLQESLGLRR